MKGYFTYLKIKNYYHYSGDIIIFKNQGKFFSDSGIDYPDDGIIDPFVLISNLFADERIDEVKKFLDFVNFHIGIKFDPDTFEWDSCSWAIARFYPEAFDSRKFNWVKDSWTVARYCPEHFDFEKYNWEKDSWAVAKYCPEKVVYQKYNWRDISAKHHAIEAGFIPPDPDYWEQKLIERFHK